MSDADEDLDDIRERKREELIERAAGQDSDGRGSETDGEDASPTAGQNASATAEGPSEPIYVEGQSHLEELIATHDVLLVDFYADWCGPCKMLEPTVAEIAADTTAAVAKVDVDAHGNIAADYRVQGVPTLYLFANGESVERLVGVQDPGTLGRLVDQYT